MKKSMEKLRTFTVFLLKPHIKEYADALIERDVQSKHLHGGMDFIGQLFVQQSERDDPEWLRFLRTGVAARIEPFSSSSLAAVLFITTAKRIFAVTFGYGRYLLDPECYERRFGLKAVVNRVAEDKISTIDIKRFEDIVVKRREEMSRNAGLGAFGVNIRQDMLRAVTGIPSGTTLEGLPGKSVMKMTGHDALVLNARVTFKQLGLLCRGALKAFEDTIYKLRGWKWIDNLSPVTDPAKVDELDQQLIDDLKAKRLSNIEMTLPEDIDTSTVTGLGYTNDDGQYIQLDVNEWYETIKDEVASLTSLSLRSRRVKLFGSDGGEALGPISAYACLNYEPMAKSSSRFLLANGEWFEVSVDYEREIEAFIKRISATTADLPNALSDETEPNYITRVSGLKKLHPLHTKVFTVDGQMVEVCDFISNDGHLIHLKVWTASATFSHLLSQGAVSAETLAIKPEYRKSIHDYLLGEKNKISMLFSEDGFIPKHLEVVFGLIRSSKRPLPFFSRLNLMRNGERIQMMGYKVGFKRIPQ